MIEVLLGTGKQSCPIQIMNPEFTPAAQTMAFHAFVWLFCAIATKPRTDRLRLVMVMGGASAASPQPTPGRSNSRSFAGALPISLESARGREAFSPVLRLRHFHRCDHFYCVCVLVDSDCSIPTSATDTQLSPSSLPFSKIRVAAS